MKIAIKEGKQVKEENVEIENEDLSFNKLESWAEFKTILQAWSPGDFRLASVSIKDQAGFHLDKQEPYSLVKTGDQICLWTRL